MNWSQPLTVQSSVLFLCSYFSLSWHIMHKLWESVLSFCVLGLLWLCDFHFVDRKHAVLFLCVSVILYSQNGYQLNTIKSRNLCHRNSLVRGSSQMANIVRSITTSHWSFELWYVKHFSSSYSTQVNEPQAMGSERSYQKFSMMHLPCYCTISSPGRWERCWNTMLKSTPWHINKRINYKPGISGIRGCES